MWPQDPVKMNYEPDKRCFFIQEVLKECLSRIFTKCLSKNKWINDIIDTISPMSPNKKMLSLS